MLEQYYSSNTLMEARIDPEVGSNYQDSKYWNSCQHSLDNPKVAESHEVESFPKTKIEKIENIEKIYKLKDGVQEPFSPKEIKED